MDKDIHHSFEEMNNALKKKVEHEVERTIWAVNNELMPFFIPAGPLQVSFTLSYPFKHCLTSATDPVEKLCNNQIRHALRLEQNNG